MSLRGMFEGTVGRRLLFRIWFHGVLLLAGLLLSVLIAHEVMFDHDSWMLIRSRPYLAQATADRVLSRYPDRAALVTELGAAHAETSLELSVFDAGGTVLASTTDSPIVATDAERRALAQAVGRIEWSDDRLVVGAFRDGRLVAYAVLIAPPGHSFPWHLAGLIAAALILAFVFVAAPLSRSIARPIERLGILARELGAGNLAVRANAERQDEIGDLATSFNTMAGQIEQLRAAERQLLNDVSHELRTPLARMRVVLDLAHDADRERVRRYLSEITTDLAELEQLVDDIIVSSRLEPNGRRWDEARPPLRRTFVAIDDLVDTAVQRFHARWPEREVTYDCGGARTVVDADPAMLRRALDNLLDNARKYSEPTTSITIRVARQMLGDRSGVRVEVVDRGVGIALSDRDRVFSAFFRADRSRARSSGGVGLGLALARRIVEAHDGTIGFDSEIDRGSTFWFVLSTAEVET